MPKQSRMTTSRSGRLSQLGRLAGSLAGSALASGAKQLITGQRPALGDLLLTPENARKVGERLSEMRGAAMKVGQLLSMDNGHIMPRELSSVLASLREDAHQMPLGQVAKVLQGEWGENWQQVFKRFNFTPLASASIGQVHEAELRDGKRLAIKVQYPGVRESIDSDVDNVAALLRLSRLLPEGLDFTPLLDEAKRQLHAEADYRTEAGLLKRFQAQVADDQRFVVPEVHDELTRRATLSMDFLDGHPIEALREAPAEQRNRVGTALLELALREAFEWGLVQTDPNFANYRFAPDTQRVQLLDFGATRVYGDEEVANLRQLLLASTDGTDQDVLRHASAVGYVGPDDPLNYQNSIVKLLRLVTEPISSDTDFAFHRSDLAERMRDHVIEMRTREKYTRLPPPAVLFLHRKLGGLYLLLSTLETRLPVNELVSQVFAGNTGAIAVAESTGRRSGKA